MMHVFLGRGSTVLAVYVGSLLFGGLLIVASLFGAGHDTDIHVDLHGGDHGGDGHDQGHASAWLTLFGLRFWSFGAAFFGLTGIILNTIGGPLLGIAVPFIAAGVGIAAGLGASVTFRALSRDTVGQLRGAAAMIGREGRFLLPVTRGQQGKVRVAVPGSGDVDMVAESDDAGVLPVGTVVLIVEFRGNVAVVERATATADSP